MKKWILATLLLSLLAPVVASCSSSSTAKTTNSTMTSTSGDTVKIVNFSFTLLGASFPPSSQDDRMRVNQIVTRKPDVWKRNNIERK